MDISNHEGICSSKHIIWCDNFSKLLLATSSCFHARPKHLELDVHSLRDNMLARSVDELNCVEEIFSMDW